VPDSPRQRLALALALVLGVHARLYALDHGLWLDEAWVANSVLEPSWGAMFAYDSWLQTTPPLFLVLQRLLTSVFGTANWVWRLLPSLAAIALLVISVPLSRRVLRPWVAAAYVLALALSPLLVVYAGMAKPYATDALAAGVLLWSGLGTSDPRWRLVAVPVLGLLSYTSLLFLPGLMWVALDDDERDLVHAGALGAVGAVTAVVAQGVFIAPNRGESLVDYWELGFYTDFGRWSGRVLTTLGEPSFGPPDLHTATSLSALVGLALLVRRSADRRARHQLAMLASAPAALVVLNLLGVYPIAPRLTLFLAPAWLLLAALPFDALTTQTERDELDAVWAGLYALTVLSVVASEGALHLVPPVREDAGAAVAHLRQRTRDGDLVYVHASMHEPYRLYARSGAPEGRVLLGRIGWPCCPRWEDGKPEDDVDAELASLEPLPARVWLLHTARRAHWDYVGRDDRTLLREHLTARGCASMGRESFDRVAVEGFTCSGDAARE
jgi:hypothetical protein